MFLSYLHASIVSGRVEIKLNVGLPIDTELVEPLQESSIWRQARGAAAEVLGSGGVIGSSEKVFTGSVEMIEKRILAFSFPSFS